MTKAVPEKREGEKERRREGDGDGDGEGGRESKKKTFIHTVCIMLYEDAFMMCVIVGVTVGCPPGCPRD